MNTGNSGIGLYNPNGTLKTPHGDYVCNIQAHACIWVRNVQPFQTWEVVLTVVAAVVLVATVVLFVRRLRAD